MSGGSVLLRVRVCELHILPRSSAASRYYYHSTLDHLDSFNVDGLYVVLRLGNEVRWTPCLWSNTPPDAIEDGSALGETAGDDAPPGQRASYRWNRLFVFSLDAASGAAPGGSPMLAGKAPPPPFAVPPLLELELWRSTTLGENQLSRSALNLTAECQAGCGGVIDRVVALQQQPAGVEAPRLGVRLRLRAEGPAWEGAAGVPLEGRVGAAATGLLPAPWGMAAEGPMQGGFASLAPPWPPCGAFERYPGEREGERPAVFPTPPLSYLAPPNPPSDGRDHFVGPYGTPGSGYGGVEDDSGSPSKISNGILSFYPLH